MGTKAVVAGASPERIISTPSVTPVQMVAPIAASPATDDASDLRLIIERDESSGTYIYTTVNRRTGEIVQRLPREALLRMRGDTGYAEGAVIRTKA